jgi:hypothetical protein
VLQLLRVWLVHGKNGDMKGAAIFKKKVKGGDIFALEHTKSLSTPGLLFHQKITRCIREYVQLTGDA